MFPPIQPNSPPVSVLRKRSLFALWLFPSLLVILHYVIYCQVPIRIWDEAIYANNALEMVGADNKFVLHNHGLPTLYNTKPPLVIWLQAVCVWLIGPSAGAIRLPSLLAALGTLALLVWYLNKFRCPKPGILAALLILVSSKGYMGPHVASTGDLDAVLVFWTTWITLHTIELLFFMKLPQARGVWGLAFLFLMGYFTKSTSAFLLLPGLVMLLFVSPNGRALIRLPATYYAAVAFLFTLSVYYLAMDRMLPGYLSTVWHSEYTRLYRNIMPWHEHPWYFYLQNFGERFFPWWILVFPATVWALIAGKRRPLAFGLAIVALGYLLLVSIPKVKLIWYDAPLYPLLAAVTGTAIGARLYQLPTRRYPLARLMTPVFVLLSVLWFASNLRQFLQDPLDDLEKPGAFLHELKSLGLQGSKWVYFKAEHPEHLDQLHFYVKASQRWLEAQSKIATTGRTFVGGEQVVTCQTSVTDSILQHYEADTIYRKGDCLLFRIRREK